MIPQDVAMLLLSFLASAGFTAGYFIGKRTERRAGEARAECFECEHHGAYLPLPKAMTDGHKHRTETGHITVVVARRG